MELACEQGCSQKSFVRAAISMLRGYILMSPCVKACKAAQSPLLLGGFDPSHSGGGGPPSVSFVNLETGTTTCQDVRY